MAQIKHVMDMAVRHHQAGRLDMAQGLYAQVLEAHPRHPGALASLGALLLQKGRVEEALEMLQEAAGLEPDNPRLLNNLGLAYRAAGQEDRAETCFRRALVRDPGAHQAAANLADLLLQRGEEQEALEMLRRVCRQQPEHPPAHYNLGMALAQAGDLAGAQAAFQRCLDLDEDFAPAWNNLAGTLHGRGRPDQAIAAYERALLLDPLNPLVGHNLGRALLDCGHFELALERLREVESIWPHQAPVQNSLGLALMGLGRVKEAVAAFLQALAEEETYRPAQLNLAGALLCLGELEGAEEACAVVLEADPGNRAAHLLRARIRLLGGDYGRAWPEWMLRPRPNQPEMPAWDGSSPAGEDILLWAEGAPDRCLLFMRLIPLLADRGAGFWLAAHPGLAGLQWDLPGLKGVLEPGREIPPACRRAASLLDLGALLGVEAEQVPPGPFIQPRAELRRRWRRALPGPGPRIGLAWRVESPPLEAACQSPPPEALAPLFELEEAAIIPLQEPPYPDGLSPGRLQPPREADSLVALMAELDLVVCVPGLVAELAGAAGLEHWVLLGPGPDWSWGLGEHSPWHPGARLFRAREVEDWSRPARELGRALSRWRRG